VSYLNYLLHINL